MAYFELYPRRLNPLLNGTCPHCEATMWLVVIEPAKLGGDKLTFECTEWGREEFVDRRAFALRRPEQKTSWSQTKGIRE